MTYSYILGVRTDNFSRQEMLEKIGFFLSEPRFHQIATVNPEFILEAEKNEEFKKVLNTCNLNVADGFGLNLALWRQGKRLKCRIAGADLMLEILRVANEKKLDVFLAANKDGLSNWKETKEAILKLYPDLNIQGGDFAINKGFKLQASSCEVLFCNFGHPYQELFLSGQKNGKIRLAMGVGGSFDFLTGKIKRAPVFMRRMGLEWFWRIFQSQPWEYKKKRIKRIINAVIIFPIKVLFYK